MNIFAIRNKYIIMISIAEKGYSIFVINIIIKNNIDHVI